MLQAEQIQGVAVDVDDTLIRTINVENPSHSLHELARLEAIHEVGKRYELTALMTVTYQENLDAFLQAPTHTLVDTVWLILLRAGAVTSATRDPEHPLLHEIITLKNELYAPVLRSQGAAIPDAPWFMHRMGRLLPAERFAIASSAIRRDVDIAVELTGLNTYFDDPRIISFESVEHPKPHPEPFDLAFRSLQLPETSRAFVLAIDDSPKGVASAKAAGLYACALTTWLPAEDFLTSDFQPDIIAASYKELDELLGLTQALGRDE